MFQFAAFHIQKYSIQRYTLDVDDYGCLDKLMRAELSGYEEDSSLTLDQELWLGPPLTCSYFSMGAICQRFSGGLETLESSFERN